MERSSLTSNAIRWSTSWQIARESMQICGDSAETSILKRRCRLGDRARVPTVLHALSVKPSRFRVLRDTRPPPRMPASEPTTEQKVG